MFTKCTMENLEGPGGHSFYKLKISTFVDILGLCDQVERVLDVYFTQFLLRKASKAIKKY